MRRQTLHTSEVYEAKKKLEKALATISPDTDVTTYIPTEEVDEAITLLWAAATLLSAKVDDKGDENAWFWSAIHQGNHR